MDDDVPINDFVDDVVDVDPVVDTFDTVDPCSLTNFLVIYLQIV